MAVRVERVADPLAPRPVPQAIEPLAAGGGRAVQRGGRISAAQVKLTPLAGAAADLPGQEPPYRRRA